MKRSGSRPTARAKTLEVTVGHDGAARILDLSAQPIGTTDKRSTMVLLHDVTAQRARLRELTNFAGMVAHDLRGPLTVLDGWLEVAEDGDAEADAELGRRRRCARPGSPAAVAPGDRGLAELHRRPERPAASRGREAVRGRQRDRGRPPGTLGRRRRAPVPSSTSTTACSPIPRCCVSCWTTWSATRSSTPRPTRQPWVQISSEHDEEPGWVRVEVTDRGVGIPEGEEELIFEEFHRGPAGGTLRGHGASASRSPDASSGCTAVSCARGATRRAARPSRFTLPEA